MKELRKFDFTIEEYLNNPSEVLAKAIAGMTSQSLTEREVLEYLQGKCRQKMMDSFSWDALMMPIIENGFMSCVVDGHRMEFLVTVAPRYMCVSLHRDGILSERVIELDSASSAILTECPYEPSPISDYGLEKAKSLAVELYYGK